jgi:hypothetical protein
MAKRPTVSTITSGHASITSLNANFVALRDAFDNTLSRDGSSPNTMSADIDLNGNDITNVNTITDSTGTDVVAAAAASATAAATSATLSGNYANKTDGVVTGTDYSSKAWAIGGTGITDTAGKGPAKDWAIETTGTVDGTNHSSKAWAIGGTGVTDTASSGAAKEWATKTSDTVDTSEYSAKEYAVGTQTRGTTGSAKDWATYTGGTVNSTEFSAKYYAQQAAASATSAAGKVDEIEAFYLGAATSDPTTDQNGDPLTSGDFYFNTSTNVTRFFNEDSSSFVNGAAAGDAFEPAGNSLALAIALG